MRHFAPLCALLLGACMTSHSASTTSTAPNASVSAASPASDDPYIWLEDIEGDRAMQWVKAHNTTSLGTLRSDPRYEKLHGDALRIVEATDRIATPDIRGRTIYNFWQDPTHVRGILRRTTPASYRSANPEWETVLDVDALSAREGANWVWHGIDLPPSRGAALSRRAVERRQGCRRDPRVRRRDEAVRRRRVPAPGVEGGRDVGRREHAARLARLRARHAHEVGISVRREAPRARQAARSGGGGVPRLARPRRRPTRSRCATPTAGCRRCSRAANITFYEGEIWLLRDDGPAVELPFPKRNGIRGLVDGQLVFTTEIAWNGFETGDLLAYDLAALKRDPASAKPTLVLRPGARESIEGVTVTRNTLVVNLSENVKGAAYVYRTARTAGRARGSRFPRTRRSASAPRRARATSCSSRCRAISCPAACGSPTPRRGRWRR